MATLEEERSGQNFHDRIYSKKKNLLFRTKKKKGGEGHRLGGNERFHKRLYALSAKSKWKGSGPWPKEIEGISDRLRNARETRAKEGW